MSTDSARRLLASYPLTMTVAVRYRDLDPQDHVNNVAIADYYQELRVLFHEGLSDGDRPAGSRALVAHHAMDYLAEIDYPGQVTVGLRVARLGRSSYTLELALFHKEACAGVATTVMVHAEAAGPAPLPAGMRAYLERFQRSRTLKS